MENTENMRRIAAKLKEEIAQEVKSTKVSNKQSYCTENCVNEYTQYEYPFQVGSGDERTLFRVMPVNGQKKMFFESEDEYLRWRQSKMVRSLKQGLM